MDIAKIDKNFAVRTKIADREGLRFYSVDSAPFSLHGIFFEGDRYRRLPESVARTVNSGVLRLHANTAGGRVRFVTDSPYIAVHVKLANCGKMPHFPLTGSIGMDLYTGTRYLGTFCPPFDVENSFEGAIITHLEGKREYTVNLPLYSEVKELYIGVKEGSALEGAPAYTVEKPVVFYGSSITQGGCASRPGNAYPAILSRKLDFDYINLGFSGNAKGEKEIAEYIAGLSMSAFVLDYDHNAPTPAHLAATHEEMFKTIRKTHPDLPILMLSRPQPYLKPEEQERLAIVRRTYENALATGDRNVYFIAGPDLICDAVREAALVDNCHPNDAGFVSMARAIGACLGTMLGLAGK